MKLNIMLMAVLLMNAGCIKYKKTYKPAGSGAEADVESASEEGGTSGEGGTSEEVDTEADTALVGNVLDTVVATSKTQVFEVDVNLNGKHSKAKKVEIIKGEANIIISNLPAIQSGQLRLEVSDGKDLQFSTRLSNVTLSAERDLKVVLSKCRPTPQSNEKDKEVTCNWSAEQPM
ncbi:MAG: hypothetical protein H7318_03925 [Oligoflexus sp.]|nr:hypothetical protein [Oligoflexus sp.]